MREPGCVNFSQDRFDNSYNNNTGDRAEFEFHTDDRCLNATDERHDFLDIPHDDPDRQSTNSCEHENDPDNEVNELDDPYSNLAVVELNVGERRAYSRA